MDPMMTGYQQHPSLVSAGLVDYVPHQDAIDMTQVRKDDETADKAYRG
jgi:hypothetical protein